MESYSRLTDRFEKANGYAWKSEIVGVLKGLGGIENIKVLESNCFVLSASIYYANKLDTSRLKRLGASKIVGTVTGFDIYFGATSTMIRKGIEKERRNVK